MSDLFFWHQMLTLSSSISAVVILLLLQWPSTATRTHGNTSISAGVFEYEFKYCTDIIFRDASSKYIDLDAMLYTCMNNSPSSLFPPSYFSDVHSNYRATNVSIQIALNNIIHVDDLTSQFTMDFFFRIIWTDPRLALPPELWKNYLHPKAQQEGIEISKYFALQEELKFWLPDIYFSQSTEVETLNNLIKLKENGTMYWARQMIVTFSNPQMPFYEFPNDKQKFTITLESFSYDSDFIRLHFEPDKQDPTISKPVVLLSDAQQDNKPLVKTNQIWKYSHEQSEIITTEAPSPTNPLRTYSTAFINLHFSRQSNGVIFRLALPVLIFLMIVGASFWSNEEERMEVTLQIILVVAALYVIIGQSIPFVGYLTKMDLYIIGVFVILCVTITVHFFTTQLSRKAAKYPLDGFYRDTMVILFRGFWMPLSMGLFVGSFGWVHNALIVILAFFAGTCILFFTGKMSLLIRSYFLSLIRLKIKSDLVALEALDEKTELPMKLTITERWALRLAQCFQRDGNTHMTQLFQKYRPGLDCSNGVTGIPINHPTTSVPSNQQQQQLQYQQLSEDSAGYGNGRNGAPRGTILGRHQNHKRNASSRSIKPLFGSNHSMLGEQHQQYRDVYRDVHIVDDVAGVESMMLRRKPSDSGMSVSVSSSRRSSRSDLSFSRAASINREERPYPSGDNGSTTLKWKQPQLETVTTTATNSTSTNTVGLNTLSEDYHFQRRPNSWKNRNFIDLPSSNRSENDRSDGTIPSISMPPRDADNDEEDIVANSTLLNLPQVMTAEPRLTDIYFDNHSSTPFEMGSFDPSSDSAVFTEEGYMEKPPSPPPKLSQQHTSSNLKSQPTPMNRKSHLDGTTILTPDGVAATMIRRHQSQERLKMDNNNDREEPAIRRKPSRNQMIADDLVLERNRMKDKRDQGDVRNRFGELVRTQSNKGNSSNDESLQYYGDTPRGGSNLRGKRSSSMSDMENAQLNPKHLREMQRPPRDPSRISIGKGAGSFYGRDGLELQSRPHQRRGARNQNFEYQEETDSQQDSSYYDDDQLYRRDGVMKHRYSAAISSVDESSVVDDNTILEEEDEDADDEEAVALITFKKTIAKEMGAVFKKREQAIQFISNNSIRPRGQMLQRSTSSSGSTGRWKMK